VVILVALNSPIVSTYFTHFSLVFGWEEDEDEEEVVVVVVGAKTAWLVFLENELWDLLPFVEIDAVLTNSFLHHLPGASVVGSIYRCFVWW
jgi:hypothetical protein